LVVPVVVHGVRKLLLCVAPKVHECRFVGKYAPGLVVYDPLAAVWTVHFTVSFTLDIFMLKLLLFIVKTTKMTRALLPASLLPQIIHVC
jgi:hypothetical protein